MRRLLLSAVGVLGAASVAACGATNHPPAAASATQRDPDTPRALLAIARRFNDDYAAGRSAAVYDRWDAPSRAIISRAEYIRRHRECATSPGAAEVESAVPAGRWWLVHYSISGIQLTDYWSYHDGRWTFDLLRSNPQAVRLYRLPARRYLAAVGC